MPITREEINFLIYRYLEESGYSHAAYVFHSESETPQPDIPFSALPVGSLITLLQKGMTLLDIEAHTDSSGRLLPCVAPFTLFGAHTCHFENTPAPARPAAPPALPAPVIPSSITAPQLPAAPVIEAAVAAVANLPPVRIDVERAPQSWRCSLDKAAGDLVSPPRAPAPLATAASNASVRWTVALNGAGTNMFASVNSVGTGLVFDPEATIMTALTRRVPAGPAGVTILDVVAHPTLPMIALVTSDGHFEEIMCAEVQSGLVNENHNELTYRANSVVNNLQVPRANQDFIITKSCYSSNGSTVYFAGRATEATNITPGTAPAGLPAAHTAGGRPAPPDITIYWCTRLECEGPRFTMLSIRNWREISYLIACPAPASPHFVLLVGRAVNRSDVPIRSAAILRLAKPHKIAFFEGLDRFHSHDTNFTHTAWSADGAVIVLGDDRGAVSVWAIKAATRYQTKEGTKQGASADDDNTHYDYRMILPVAHFTAVGPILNVAVTACADALPAAPNLPPHNPVTGISENDDLTIRGGCYAVAYSTWVNRDALTVRVVDTRPVTRAPGGASARVAPAVRDDNADHADRDPQSSVDGRALYSTLNLSPTSSAPGGTTYTASTVNKCPWAVGLIWTGPLLTAATRTGRVTIFSQPSTTVDFLRPPHRAPLQGALQGAGRCTAPAHAPVHAGPSANEKFVIVAATETLPGQLASFTGQTAGGLAFAYGSVDGMVGAWVPDKTDVELGFASPSPSTLMTIQQQQQQQQMVVSAKLSAPTEPAPLLTTPAPAPTPAPAAAPAPAIVAPVPPAAPASAAPAAPAPAPVVAPVAPLAPIAPLAPVAPLVQAMPPPAPLFAPTTSASAFAPLRSTGESVQSSEDRQD